MDQRQYLILEYLSNKENPVSPDNLPNEIKSEFEIDPLEPGGLIYEFDIVLAQHKKWIIKKFRENGYRITDAGRVALQKAQQKKSTEDYITQLQFDKLSKEVADLENKLDNNRPTNLKANIAIILTLILLLLQLLQLLIK